MKTASMIGFWLAIGLGAAAFAWADSWWLTVLLLLAALAVAWYSVGLYSEAATAAARRATRSLATPNDEELLREIGPRARDEAFRAAGRGAGDDV